MTESIIFPSSSRGISVHCGREAWQPVAELEQNRRMEDHMPNNILRAGRVNWEQDEVTASKAFPAPSVVQTLPNSDTNWELIG